MSYDPTEQARKIRQVIRELLGLEDGAVRPANQHAALPDGLFLTVLVQGEGRYGRDNVALETNDDDEDLVDENLIGERILSCSIQAFRTGASAAIRRLPALFESSAGVTKCQAANIALLQFGEPRDLSQVLGGEWEERWQVDAEFAVQSVETFQLQTYGEFQIGTTIGELEGEITIEEPT